MSKRKSVFHKTCNSVSFNDHRLFNLLKLLTINRFKWENLPDGLESRHIEEALFHTGQIAFYEDRIYGLLALPCSSAGVLNIYGDPTEFVLTGHGFTKHINKKDCVRILNNDTATPSIIHVKYYTEYISNLETLMNDNMRQQRYPFIVTTTKQSEFTMKNLMQQIDNGEDAIFVDERLSNGGDIGINVLNTGAPFLLDKLQEHKNDVMNELMTWLGLNNANTDKKERMLVDEINVNNAHILMNLDLEYKNREKACEEINKRYGLNIKVVKAIDEFTEEQHKMMAKFVENPNESDSDKEDNE